MVHINLNLRNAKSAELSPINMVIRWKGQRLVYPTGKRILPKHWSASNQRAKGSYTTAPEFNRTLSALVTIVETTYLRFLNDNDQRIPSVEELRDRLNPVINHTAGQGSRSLFSFIRDFSARSYKRVNPTTGVLMKKESIKKYKTTLNHLEAFAQANKKRLDFDTVDMEFYHQFSTYLTSTKGLALNSVGKNIQTLKTFLRAASDEGIEVNQAFRNRNFKKLNEVTDKIYLSRKELDDMFKLDLSHNTRLEKTRDLFIVGAWTGLRFGDFTSLRPDDISGNRIKIHAGKTGSALEIPMRDCVREIFARYNGQIPQAISNQKMNKYLREVASLVHSLQERASVSATVGGVRRYITKSKAELITTHTARRSFATNAYKGDGYSGAVPVRTIMAITGHKTEQAFRLYIRLNAEEHADIMEHYMLSAL